MTFLSNSIRKTLLFVCLIGCILPNTLFGQLSYTSPGSYTITVPANAQNMQVVVRGADGGDGVEAPGGVPSVESGSYSGGAGAMITATLPVTPGHQLKVIVGASPTQIPQIYALAGGGGGGSGVFNMSTSTHLIIAGGGGGAGTDENGDGGRSTAGNGTGGDAGDSCEAGAGGGGISSNGGNAGQSINIPGGSAFNFGFSSGGTHGSVSSFDCGVGTSADGGAPNKGVNGGGGYGGGGAAGAYEEFTRKEVLCGVGSPFGGGGGGGGGYSGGDGGNGVVLGVRKVATTPNEGGQGGGSFVNSAATAQSISAGANGGGSFRNGLVEITFGCTGGVDTDMDGATDCADGCPNDPNKTEPGACGCGNLETDSDGDGTPDCVDTCPNTSKGSAGVCGCNVPDTDSDGDGTPDCIDNCPFDFFKTAPGSCGCGTSELDTDGDGTPNCIDGCPNDPDKTKPGCLGCGTPDVDQDGDGKVDCEDNCPDNFNPSQLSSFGCGCQSPSIIGVEIINTSPCDDDLDIFTADIRITFADPPTLGAVRISGDLNAGQRSDRIGFENGSKQTVFILEDKVFKADGGPISILVEYIGNEGCYFNLANAGLAPDACVELNDMPVVIRTEEIANYCLLIMKDSAIYKLVTWINGDSANTVKVQIVQTDVEKSIIILQNLQNANGKLEGFIQKLNIDPTIDIGISNPRATPKMKGRWSPPLKIDYEPNEGDDCIGIPPIKFIECFDNGTLDPSDDYLIFDMTVIGEKDKTYDLGNGIFPSKGVFNTLSTFRTPLGTANDDLFNFMVTTSDDTSCDIMVELENPGNCSGVCRITDINLTNFKQCHDQGTIIPQDDYFVADVNISFRNPPNAGFLNLDALATHTSETNAQLFFEDVVRVSELDSDSLHTFRNVEIPEGADDYFITSSFSATSCEYILENYFIPNVPCRLLAVCPPVNDLTVSLDEVNPNTVHFDWQFVPNALLFEVEIRFANLPWQTIANDSSEATIPALLPNTTYQYRIRYFCQENAWSEYVSGTFTTGSSSLVPEDSTVNNVGSQEETVNRIPVSPNSQSIFEGGGKILLFPNPARNELLVSYHSIFKSEAIKPKLFVYDLLGRPVLQQEIQLNKNQMVLNINDLEKGIYYVKLGDGRTMSVQKFIKE